jgi:hypothetical protein
MLGICTGYPLKVCKRSLEAEKSFLKAGPQLLTSSVFDRVR